MSLDEKIAAELKRQHPWQYDALKEDVEELEAERTGTNPKKVWLVTLTQTEPVWARTKKQAIKIGKETVEWAEYDGELHAEVASKATLEGISDALPWGSDTDMTCGELTKEVKS